MESDDGASFGLSQDFIIMLCDVITVCLNGMRIPKVIDINNEFRVYSFVQVMTALVFIDEADLIRRLLEH